MNERDFAYWLQGYFEINGVDKLSKKQVQVIQNHLSLVMEKKTPERQGVWSPNSVPAFGQLLGPHEVTMTC